MPATIDSKPLRTSILQLPDDCDYCGEHTKLYWTSSCGIPGHGLWMCEKCKNITFYCGLCDPEECDES